jgi:hypothetical protein
MSWSKLKLEDMEHTHDVFTVIPITYPLVCNSEFVKKSNVRCEVVALSFYISVSVTSWTADLAEMAVRNRQKIKGYHFSNVGSSCRKAVHQSGDVVCVLKIVF